MTRQDVLFPPRNPSLHDSETQIWNWAANSRLAPRSSLQVASSIEQVQELVAACPGKVRVAGNRMSAGRMLSLDNQQDILLDITPLSGLLSSTTDSVTFGGGTHLHEVFEVLTSMGRMLNASPGVIAAQTLAGAISTGTHGQGLSQSSLADEALAISFVDAAGELHEWRRDHHQFAALQLGLGTLGVICAVTLRTRPATTFTCFKQATSAQNLGDDILRWNHEWQFSKCWWFPDENKVHAWNARETTAAEHDIWLAGHRQLIEQKQTNSAMNRTVDNTLSHMRRDTRIVDDNGKPFRTVTRFKDFSDVIGDIYQVFCRGIATPQINIEIGVPLADAPEIIDKIRHWHQSARPHLHYPIILRATGSSDAWLSPAQGQPTLFFGFVVYYAADGSLSPSGLEFLRAVEKLLAECGGRPHWGKYFQPQLYDWQRLYPYWASFSETRLELDPHGKFSNDFCADLLK
ncbi:FAD-binding protein [Salmonella enterica subsp. enterica serovar Choleraesuis]|nr:FAD-binding protein [Salmonella enterica subsp. enterica serovar Choleraesuis]